MRFFEYIACNALTEEDQWRKLALVVETARTVWGDVEKCFVVGK
jgi:hypothetical protein